MSELTAFAPAIAVLPFVSFLVALFFGDYMPKKGAIAGIAATAGSLLFSLAMAWYVFAEHSFQETLYVFVEGQGTFDLTLGILLDPLSTLMLVVVSTISLLVHVFSLGYMNDEGETGLPRYYSVLGLFTASMLAFVYADNLLMAFMFFEIIGLCSYLLIGFWFREPAPASAQKKAFLVTRFGDYFFFVGLVAVFATFGTAAFGGPGVEESFPALAEAALAGGGTVTTFFGLGPQAWFSVIGLLVLGGVLGKSAQFPLHTWLPDAMEGPTPVSALIHAATMVAAGVYLVARMYGFYALLPSVLAIIALVGGFTALFAATMGIVKRELKQVLAYSTISQYGYMMLALGGGGYVAAVFHLTTHAAFKALLFLGAGSVIIAMHHNEDMWDMGGLKEEMPVTYWTFLSGSLALAGIFPFAGFWSKDEVLFETLVHGLGTAGPLGTVLLAGYAMGLLAVVFTGFYTFRMVMLTFHGEPRTEAAEDPHGVGWNVKLPLTVLGIAAAVLGVINLVPVNVISGGAVPQFLHDWLYHGPEGLNGEHFHQLLISEELPTNLSTADAFAGSEVVSILASAGLSLALALLGAGAAVALYRGPSPAAHTDKLGSVKTLLWHNYYQDEYQVWLAEGVTVPLARTADRFDQGVVDGAVNLTSSVSLFSGDRVRRIQTGVVSNYAALLALGLVALLAAFGLYQGWLL